MPSTIPFFRALNPVSTLSGVYLIKTEKPSVDNQPPEIISLEIIDITLLESIKRAWDNNNLSAFQSVVRLHEIIMGRHFDSTSEFPNAKGCLDFLIFPLLARKLICYTIRDDLYGQPGKKEGRGEFCLKLVAFIVGGILAVPRFAIGFGLTLMLAPLAMLINVLKPILKSMCCSSKGDVGVEQSEQPSPAIF